MAIHPDLTWDGILWIRENQKRAELRVTEQPCLRVWRDCSGIQGIALGEDPPDCVIEIHDGARIGVEVCRLMDEEVLRLNLSAEEEAVHLYLAHADATDNELAKKVLIDVANEERVHKGEFQRLISILSREEDGFLAQGADEVNELTAGAEPAQTAQLKPKPVEENRTIPTIGDLRRSAM